MNKVEKHPNECPFIDRRVPDPNFNKSLTYPTPEGDYIFYDHDDGFGKITRVQFCQLCGRKRDIFECFNESEWRRCTYLIAQVDWETSI